MVIFHHDEMNCGPCSNEICDVTELQRRRDEHYQLINLLESHQSGHHGSKRKSGAVGLIAAATENNLGLGG